MELEVCTLFDLIVRVGLQNILQHQFQCKRRECYMWLPLSFMVTNKLKKEELDTFCGSVGLVFLKQH